MVDNYCWENAKDGMGLLFWEAAAQVRVNPDPTFVETVAIGSLRIREDINCIVLSSFMNVSARRAANVGVFVSVCMCGSFKNLRVSVVSALKRCVSE